ncbi:MAG: DNA-binding protein [Candidatus Brocadiae bacterium]|nr:DNA-binding protein [Candidatus Brocadiia bacterium]
MLKFFLLFCLFWAGCHSPNNTNLKVYAIRLKPGEDLFSEVQKFVVENKIQAGWIATCVGSLAEYKIRFANQKEGNTGSGYFEITSLVGTLSTHGSHLHIVISDSQGQCIGGHLLQGCKIYTTAEIVIQESTEFLFTRENDGSTPWAELQIKKR